MEHNLNANVIDFQYVQMGFRQDFWDMWAKLPSTEDQGRMSRIPRTVC